MYTDMQVTPLPAAKSAENIMGANKYAIALPHHSFGCFVFHKRRNSERTVLFTPNTFNSHLEEL